ncbi:hypothetical protein [Lentilactobacillus sp. Marseille-Q4993]|uniref:hypothetical protein n=1 Tax=Lentilactobacillus sp. Marseille-Q4993 TaxID=3039492 RepID=UPI0024BCF9B9|nr:hypothetical protein [Lentilactobacillus sp. Marseille-Q4993]
MLTILIKNILLVLALLLLVPFIYTIILTLINRNTKRMVATRFGMNAQLWLGCIGIIIHETAHLLTALVFGHKIDGFRLIKFPNNVDTSLGYVNHSWNNSNWYQKAGNFLIGLAPTFACSITIILLGHWLIPTVANPVTASILSGSPLAIEWSGLTIGKLIIFILLTANICIGGFDLSSADYANSKIGLAPLIIALVVLTLLISLLSDFNSVFAILERATLILAEVLTLNCGISVLLNLVIRIV